MHFLLQGPVPGEVTLPGVARTPLFLGTHDPISVYFIFPQSPTHGHNKVITSPSQFFNIQP